MTYLELLAIAHSFEIACRDAQKLYLRAADKCGPFMTPTGIEISDMSRLAFEYDNAKDNYGRACAALCLAESEHFDRMRFWE